MYSDVDRGAPHALACDQAVPVGPAAARESYLSIDRLLAAAHSSGADAVHPGYGFLAENAAFARAVEEARLVWIGPSPAAIATMGDKLAARAAVSKAGDEHLRMTAAYRDLGREVDREFVKGEEIYEGHPAVIQNRHTRRPDVRRRGKVAAIEPPCGEATQRCPALAPAGSRRLPFRAPRSCQ